MTIITDSVFEEYRRFCEERWGITIVEKSTSWLMKSISFVLFFNKRFMTDYVTTIGTKVYWPNADKLGGQDFEVLFHEVQHVSDYKKNRPWFILSYLFPQVLALMSLLSFLALAGNLSWLLSLLWLVMLAPLPSPMRMYWEIRGAACNMAYLMWARGFVPFHTKEHIRANFISSAYYFMWPFPRVMDELLATVEEKILEGELTEVQQETGIFLVDRGLAVKAED